MEFEGIVWGVIGLMAAVALWLTLSPARKD